MAETRGHKPYIVFRNDKIFSTGSGDPPGGDGLEAQVAKLESDLGYVKRDVSELRTDMRDIRDRLTRVEVKLDGLPTKAFVFSVYGIVSALLAAVMLFQHQLQQLLGLVSGIP